MEETKTMTKQVLNKKMIIKLCIYLIYFGLMVYLIYTNFVSFNESICVTDLSNYQSIGFGEQFLQNNLCHLTSQPITYGSLIKILQLFYNLIISLILLVFGLVLFIMEDFKEEDFYLDPKEKESFEIDSGISDLLNKNDPNQKDLEEQKKKELGIYIKGGEI